MGLNERNIERAMTRSILTISDALNGPEEIKSVMYVYGIVGSCTEETDKNMKPYLTLSISDATGSVTTKIWVNQMINPETGLKRVFERGSVHLFRMSKGMYNNFPQLNYDDSIILSDDFQSLAESSIENALSIAKDVSRVYDVGIDIVAKLLECKDILGEMHRRVFDKIFGIKHRPKEQEVAIYPVQNGFIKQEIHSYRPLFCTDEDFETFRKFVYAPAAKKHHGNFVHGLIVHSLTLHDIVYLMGNVYSGHMSYPIINPDAIDWDAIKLMSLVHDFFKIDEYTWEDYGNIDSSDMATVYSHSMRMFALLEGMKKDEDSEEWANLIHKLQQMSLLHHGQWSEWVKGKHDTLFPESEVFGSIDLIDSRIASAIEK